MRRVAVTGIGVVSSIGTGKDAFWSALLGGTSGISTVSSFDSEAFPVHIGGEVKDFDPLRYLTPERAAVTGRATQMAIGAASIFYQGILDEIEKNDYDVFTRRASLSAIGKVSRIPSLWLKVKSL